VPLSRVSCRSNSGAEAILVLNENLFNKKPVMIKSKLSPPNQVLRKRRSTFSNFQIKIITDLRNNFSAISTFNSKSPKKLQIFHFCLHELLCSRQQELNECSALIVLLSKLRGQHIMTVAPGSFAIGSSSSKD